MRQPGSSDARRSRTSTSRPKKGETLLVRDVRQWRIEKQRQKDLSKLRSLLERRFGSAAAEEVCSSLSRACIEEIWRALERARYVVSWPDVLTPDYRVPAQVISVNDLPELAAGRLRSWCLRLYFHRSTNEEADYDRVKFEVPWLVSFPEYGRLIEDLRRYGYGLVACPEEGVARALLDSIRSNRVWGHLLSPDGVAVWK